MHPKNQCVFLFKNLEANEIQPFTLIVVIAHFIGPTEILLPHHVFAQ